MSKNVEPKATVPPGDAVESPQTGYEVKADPTRATSQRKLSQMKAYENEPGAWASLPNGEMVRRQRYLGGGRMYPGEVTTDLLARPGEMLLERNQDFCVGYRGDAPVFSPRYAWMVRVEMANSDRHRDNETAHLHKQGRIRYVETKEVDPNCRFASHDSYSTANFQYVTYRNLILVEILDPELSYQKYIGFEDYAIDRVTELPAQVSSFADTRYGSKAGIELRGPLDARAGG